MSLPTKARHRMNPEQTGFARHRLAAIGRDPLAGLDPRLARDMPGVQYWRETK